MVCWGFRGATVGRLLSVGTMGKMRLHRISTCYRDHVHLDDLLLTSTTKSTAGLRTLAAQT